MIKSEIPKQNTFLYFAYGDNLLRRIIHMYCPSAEFVSIARLDNYRLDFINYSKFWGGPAATMVPTANAHIWGAVWRLDTEDKSSLDNQKGVEVKNYYPTEVEVATPYMGAFTCRAYEQKVNPLPRGDNDPVPCDQWPSKTYKEIIILGCIDHGLPPYYISGLEKLQHNGDEGCLRMVELLLRYGREAPCECAVPGRVPRRPLQLDPPLLPPITKKKVKILASTNK